MDKIVKFFSVNKIKSFVVMSVIFIGILLLPFVIDVVVNEYKLISFKNEIQLYRHPDHSKLLQDIALVTHTAGASNRCDLVIAEVRESNLSKEQIQNVYNSLYQNNNANRDMHLLFLNDVTDAGILQMYFSDIYNKIPIQMQENQDAYLLMAIRTHPPNNDIRCH